MTSDKAGQVRKGLFDTVAGKAKEIAGALSSKDELAEDGQLQQAGAHARKEANSLEAVASANAEQATDELRERTDRLSEDNRRAHAVASQDKQAAVRAGAAAKADAAGQAQRQEEAGRRQAEHAADAVAAASAGDAARLEDQALRTERGAGQQHDDLETEAAEAEHRAAQLRDEATS